MESIKQLLLALGLLGSPVDHPPEPCLGNCQPSPAAVGVIKHFEGYSPVIYEDAAGYPTIGFGHLDQRAHFNRNLRFRRQENSPLAHEPDFDFLHGFLGRFSAQNGLLSEP